MPLILLGLIVVIGIVLYALVMYGRSEDTDTRSVRERYPFAFPQKKDQGANYTIIDDENDQDGAEDNTIHFPEDAEAEKRRRNIN
ncbi:MAG: hypothetical protein IJ227_03600 [Mogibacterium sp.]|nr:hypothetical protein [Mogibacterium sp.]